MRKPRTIPLSWMETATHLFVGAAAIGVLAFCVLGVVVSLKKDGFGSDAAAWAQGAGSVAAIWGAVWISGAESRRDRKQRRREREECAWSVQFAIKAARNEAYTVVHELFDPTRAGKSDDGRHWKTRCRNARLLLLSYAGRSDHIHPAIVQDANNAVLLIEELETDLEAALVDIAHGRPVAIERAESLAWYEVQLQELVQRIDDRMVGVREALDRGGDMLPIHEFNAPARAR